MAALTIRWSDVEGLERFSSALRRITSQDQFGNAARRAINRTGDMAKTQVIRSLAAQTGLKQKVIRKAIKVRRANYSSFEYVMTTRGGDIRLKYFSPRETRKGVVAKPFGKATTFPSAFMRAGWWPNRVNKPGWNGQVFRRTGAKTGKGTDQFEVVRSGVFIPAEMIRGATADAFSKSVATNLPRRFEHEIGRLTGGVMSR